MEVYWRAPDRSKQVIFGWRDGAFLPTDINYHRDHLGIVTNNFGNVIRIGEGDEVRDVPHPLSPVGLRSYDYSLGDSLAIRTAAGETVVRQVQVRPRAFNLPLVVGTLYLDIATAELVRFRFSFTPAAYLDSELEDISIVLESSLYEQRYWLPYRQEVEIRRRTTWLDFPARGIIRGRWEIEGYDLNVPLPDSLFTGPAIAGLGEPDPTDSTWSTPLSQAIAGVAPPVNRQDMDALRVEVERIAGARALSGLPSRRLAAGSVSDVVHVNRVQGLSLGFGGVFGLRQSRVQVRPWIGYGTSDHRVTGALSVSAGVGATQVTLGASRRVTDFSDLPVIAPVLNSLLSQEGGKDYGDYVLLNAASLGLRQRLSGRTALHLSASVEESRSVVTRATPARGSYRPNPALGAGTYRVGRLELERASGGIAVRRDLQGRLSLEAGEGPADYLRVAGEGRWLATLGRARSGLATLPRRRHGRASAAPQLRHRWPGHPPRRAVPRVRRPGGGPGSGGVAFRRSGAGHRARLFRLHRQQDHTGAFPGRGRGRPADPGPAVGGQRRCPPGGRRGPRMVHAPDPDRGRGRAARRRVWAHRRRESGLVGAVVAALSSQDEPSPANPRDLTTARVDDAVHR